MDILISYDNQVIPVALAEGNSVAVYAVPRDYSHDGLYLAQWGAGELEPVPACAADLVLRLSLNAGADGETALAEHFKAEGATYAAN